MTGWGNRLYVKITEVLSSEIYGLQAKTHQQFKQKYGGRVFYIISIRQGNQKVIYNTDVIEEIKGNCSRCSRPKV